MKFEDYMENEILKPLGLTSSKYIWDSKLLENAATPYDDGEPTEYFRYVGNAAASLNSTLNDLLHWLSITLVFFESDVLNTTSFNYNLFQDMITPASATQRQYALRYGLGYELWPIGEDSFYWS
jgi:CubicO group peptidase (beta-lactamase class C family)